MFTACVGLVLWLHTCAISNYFLTQLIRKVSQKNECVIFEKHLIYDMLANNMRFSCAVSIKTNSNNYRKVSNFDILTA